MSKVPVDIENRPRTTKNVYFFKSGDHSFDGVRLPINLRRYRTLDALLDDLSGKIPGLPRGVRQLRTPQGRNQVEKLDQLRHLGGYVCTEKLSQGRIPGINFDKVKSPKDLLSHETFSNSFLPPKPNHTAANTSPKRKKKKKKKKVKKVLVDEDGQVINNNPEEDAVDDFVQNFRDNEENPQFKNQYEDQNEYENEDNDRENYDNENDRSQENLEDIEEEDEEFHHETRRSMQSNRNDYSNEPEEDFMTTTEVVGKPSFSAPGTPAEIRKFDDSPLAPLDNTKLKHVQRRRVANKQINAEDYTLPSSERSSISKSTTKTKKSTKSKKSQPNMQPRYSFDDRMRIEEYNSDQQDKIFELEGKRETTTATKIQKTRSVTPTSMRSITPLHENESSSKQENHQRIESIPITAHSRLQRVVSNSKSNSSSKMAIAASQLVQHETATNLEMAYGGHSQNDDSASNRATPFEENLQSENDETHDDHEKAASARNQRSDVEDDPDHEVNEWHDFMSSINEETRLSEDRENDHEAGKRNEISNQSPADSQFHDDLSEEEIHQGEIDESDEGLPNQHRLHSNYETSDHPDHHNGQNEMDRWNSEEESGEIQNGPHKDRRSAKSNQNRNDSALDEEWVDEFGARRKSQFIIVSHPEDEVDEFHRLKSSDAHSEVQKHQMHKNTLRDSGLSSIDGEAITAV